MKSRLIAVCVLACAVSASAQTLPGNPPGRAALDLGRLLPTADGAEDGRRTLGAFSHNLGRSFVGMFAGDNLAPLLLGVAATGGASRFDRPAHDRLLGQAPGLSRAASTLGGLTVMAPMTLGLFASGRFAHDTRFRAFSYDATQAMIVNGVYTEILKRATRRTRPDGSDALSFPSGHASNAFALATVAGRHYGWKLGVPSYLAASAIGLSRISNDKHHISDVLAGATLGVIAGRTVVRHNGEPLGRRTRVSLGPVSDARGAGVGLGGSITW